MRNLILGIVLFLTAIVLIVILTPINFFVVWKKDYFRDTALSLDKWANREFRATWNKYLITDEGYKFGNINESISAVLGVNILKGTLSKKGEILVKILTRKHCLDAI